MIDACMLSGSDSTFLQQATHLTGGIYLRPRLRGALLQYLLVRRLTPTSHLASSPRHRIGLHLPTA